MADIVANTSEISANPSEVKLNVTHKPDIFMKYHTSEIQQNEAIIDNAIKMIWVGVILIIVVVIIAVYRESNTTLLMAISGVFIDLFGATIIHLADKSSENKQKNLENLSILEHEQRIMEFIRMTDSSDKFQCDMVSKIVDRHCLTKK